MNDYIIRRRGGVNNLPFYFKQFKSLKHELFKKRV